MARDEDKLRTTGWIVIALLALGQLLPWSYRARPIGEVWDWLFSSISRPNPEWWIWFLAPVIALALATKGLIQERKIPASVLFPIGLFVATWAALILTGIRRYTGLRSPGFLLTFIGLLVLGLLVFAGKRQITSNTTPCGDEAADDG